MRRLALLLLVLAPSLPRPTGACSVLPNNQEHAVDATFDTDAVPPSAVVASASLDNNSESGGGCGDACGNGGSFVFISVNATDDQAPTARLGYKLSVVGPEPSGFTIPTTALIADAGELRLRYLGTGAFAFDLEIRAVDLNGNLGPSTVVAISSAE